MQQRHLNGYREPDNKKWRRKSIQGYGVYQILDCLDCFLVFFSGVISPLLSRSRFNQNQTTSQSISAWLPANTFHNICGSLCHYLHNLSLHFWTVLSSIKLDKHLCAQAVWLNRVRNIAMSRVRVIYLALPVLALPATYQHRACNAPQQGEWLCMQDASCTHRLEHSTT